MIVTLCYKLNAVLPHGAPSLEGLIWEQLRAQAQLSWHLIICMDTQLGPPFTHRLLAQIHLQQPKDQSDSMAP